MLTRFTPQRRHAATSSGVTSSGLASTVTFRDASKEKHILLYLIAFFFFIDGVYTIIDMATAYGTALGLDSTGLLLALLVTQFVAFPFAILFGRLSAAKDTGKLIKLCILAYTGITLFAVFLKSQWQFCFQLAGGFALLGLLIYIALKKRR